MINLATWTYVRLFHTRSCQSETSSEELARWELKAAEVEFVVHRAVCNQWRHLWYSRFVCWQTARESALGLFEAMKRSEHPSYQSHWFPLTRHFRVCSGKVVPKSCDSLELAQTGSANMLVLLIDLKLECVSWSSPCCEGPQATTSAASREHTLQLVQPERYAPEKEASLHQHM